MDIRTVLYDYSKLRRFSQPEMSKNLCAGGLAAAFIESLQHFPPPPVVFAARLCYDIDNLYELSYGSAPQASERALPVRPQRRSAGVFQIFQECDRFLRKEPLP